MRERGVFYTSCFAGPMFATEIPVDIGDSVCRDGFWCADVAPPAGGLHPP